MSLLESIERRLLEELNPKVKLLLETGRYLIEGGGKRLRPLLTVLSCGMCGGEPERAIPLGVGLEYIHAASLLHDDVVDGAGRRRGRSSANSVFGNEVAVLTGDYMYAKALHLFATYGNAEMIRVVSDAVMEMAQAQVLELSRVGELISEREYLRIIDGKTAALFGACTAVGGMAGGWERWEELYRIGIHIGRAFQLIDDLLDYAGDPSTIGKPVGNDLREGKATYPLLSVLGELGEERARTILEKVNPSREEIDTLRKEVIRLGGGERTRRRASEELAIAKRLLSRFPDNEYKKEILKIIELVIKRDL